MIFLAAASWSVVAMAIGLGFGIDGLLLGGFVALCLSFAAFHVNEWFQAWRARRWVDHIEDDDSDWRWPERAA